METLFGDPASAPARHAGRFARVATERGLDRHPDGLTYRVPDDLADLEVGDRVLVPLGRGDKPTGGVVLAIEAATDLDPARLKPIKGRDRGAVNLPPDLIELARWISAYYCCPLGTVLTTLVPAAVKKGVGRRKRVLVDLAHPISTEALPSIVQDRGLTDLQTETLGKVLELAQLHRLPMNAKDLRDAVGAKTTAPITALIDKGLLHRVERTKIDAAWGRRTIEEDQKHALNDDQQRVLEALTAGLDAGFRVNLLHGVTGSGKTEVYIRLMQRVIEAGRTVIVLTPEISLSSQAEWRLFGRFQRTAILHSGLTAAQRNNQWDCIRRGEADVVVGARSAVFAPLPKLGLIVVDEEHDSAYKQDQAPRYHARSVAIKRAHMLGIPVLLGSATPSLESYHAATHRRQYRLLELPHRVSDFPLPPVDIVNLREEPAKRYQYTGSRSWHLLSLRLEKQLQKTLKEGGQAILLLNRRGYANYIACPDHRCGWTMQCEFCDAMMVYHVDRDLPTGGYVRCHYCGFENRLPSGCPVCQKKLTVFGLGTQRVEEEIERKFPNARLARIDSDTMRSAKHYAQTLGDFRAGRVDLLVGTQMIAKGLDFPNVRLVGVISADTSLALPDFRAAERTFQLVAQVAGRSGRSAEGGRVVVQTFAPDHPAIQLAAKHDYPAFAKRELAARERARMPPVTRIARIVVRDENAERCDRDAAELAARLGEYRDAMDLAVRVMGPMRPPRARVGGYHRREIQLIADNAATLQRLMTALRNAALLKSDAHTAVDVDPITLM